MCSGRSIHARRTKKLLEHKVRTFSNAIHREQKKRGKKRRDTKIGVTWCITDQVCNASCQSAGRSNAITSWSSNLMHTSYVIHSSSSLIQEHFVDFFWWPDPRQLFEPQIVLPVRQPLQRPRTEALRVGSYEKPKGALVARHPRYPTPNIHVTARLSSALLAPFLRIQMYTTI